MTDTPKRRKLSHEILGLIAIAALLSLILFLVLSGIATGVTEEYVFNHDIPMDEFDWIAMYQRIYTIAAVLSCIAFSVLFLAMIQSRIAYIQTITEGIGQLQGQPKKMDLPLKGNNELKFLAEAVNDMSEAQLALREQEQALALAAIGAVMLERLSKGSEKKFLLSQVLASAALVIGMFNAFM